MSEIEQVLDQVAIELAWLAQEPVFIGGATIGLYLDEFGRGQLRPTKDVDCIVPEVTSRVAWWELEAQLRSRGWTPAPTGPICRYLSPSGVLVDLMSLDPEVLGFSGRWYPEAVAGAERRVLATTRSILVPTPHHLLAFKIEAWSDRGRGDPWLSPDLEDVVALLDGCHELESRLHTASDDLLRSVASSFRAILDDATTLEAVTGHLPRGGDFVAREERVLALMARLAAQGTR